MSPLAEEPLRHVRLLIPLLGLVAVITVVQTIDFLHRRDQERRAAIAAGTEGILRAKLSRVAYTQLPLRETLDDYARMAHLPLKVNWDLLQAQGVDPEQPVNARLYNVRAEKGLSVLLDSASTPSQRLGYVVAEDGTIEVLAKPIWPETAVVEVYDTSDLLIVALADKVLEQSKTLDELIHDVVMLITDTVANDSWETNGGKVGRIRYFHDKLVITQTPEAQRLVANLLEQLRAMRSLDPERRRLEMRLLFDDGGGK